MHLEASVRDAIVAELKRQAEARPNTLKIADRGEGKLRIEGEPDLDELVMAVVGAVAGGP